MEKQPKSESKNILNAWWEKFVGFVKEHPAVAALVGVGLLTLA